METIQERVKAKLDKNKKHAQKALAYANGLFMKMYDSLAMTANITNNSVCVYIKLFSVNDENQYRLVKSKMANIFKSYVRWAVLLNASDSTQGIFGGESNVFKNLEENKKQSALIKSVLLQTNKTGKVGKKPGTK